MEEFISIHSDVIFSWGYDRWRHCEFCGTKENAGGVEEEEDEGKEIDEKECIPNISEALAAIKIVSWFMLTSKGMTEKEEAPVQLIENRLAQKFICSKSKRETKIKDFSNKINLKFLFIICIQYSKKVVYFLF